ncbi:MAG: carboxymuconolactone decarboxylase family protein [Ignavibacteriales bacterium]|nr:carboxymuconolactone decarboxylase family protein [Ignavibacteriales bacterium]
MEKTNLKWHFHTLETAPQKSKEILEAAKTSMGMIPNMYAAMANNPVLLEAYTSSYKLFRNSPDFSAIEHEIIFLSISVANECKYCVAAHSMVADKMSEVPAEITNSIRDGKQIPDAKLETLRRFTQALVNNRGHVNDNEIAQFIEAGYSQIQILGILTAIGIKTISNYMNHIIDTPVDEAFKYREWDSK